MREFESLLADPPWLASWKRQGSSFPITQDQKSCGSSEEMNYIPVSLTLGESDLR